MALDPKIAAFKSSGVYRLEFDKSQTVSIPAEQLRLIVGFSKQGPFNTPVFVSDSSFFQSVFGSIDRSLERNGSFFHRSAQTALERGPILALNLLRLNNDATTGDKDQAFIFSASSTEANEGFENELYSGYYNQDGFWFPDTEAFLNNISYTRNSLDKLFNLVNLGRTPSTVIVRKAAANNVRGLNLTVEEFYGSANIPDFLNKDSLLSDFMVDVIVIKGNFGPAASATYPYERFAADPTWSRYFDKQTGIRRKVSATDTEDTLLQEFLNLPEVEEIATYTGSLLPDFTDLNGNNLFIQTLINAETAVTGLFCAVNETAFDTGLLIDGVDGGIDLIGHELERLQPTTVDFLSYKGTIVADNSYAGSYSLANTLANFNDASIVKSTNTDGDIEIAVSASSNPTAYAALSGFTANVSNPRTLGTYLFDGTSWVPVIGVVSTPSAVVVTLSPTGTSLPIIQGITTLSYLNPADIDFVAQKDDDSGTILGAQNSALYEDVADGVLTDGDKAVFGAAFSTADTVYLDVNIDELDAIYWNNGTSDFESNISDTDYPIPVATVNAYEDSAFTSPITTDADFGINQPGEFFFDTDQAAAAAGTFVSQTFIGSLNNSVTAAEWFGKAGSSLLGNEVIIPASDAEYFATGYYLVNNPGNTGGGVSSRLTRINEVISLTNYTPAGGGFPTGNYLKVVCQSTVYLFSLSGGKQVEAYQPITNWFNTYQTFNLPGFQLGAYNLPNGTNAQQNNILNDTLSGTNLFNALIDKENISFRYLVDTFANGIEAGSKSIYGTLAKDRQNVLALVNAPSVQNFKDSTDPSFKNLLGQFETRFIPTGGDLSKNPTVRYTLPGIPQGSNYMAYYTPFLTVNDNGTNINVPPAAAVSNNFIQKYTDATPWSIVAGARRGIISGRGIVGLEYNYSKEDRDNIEPFGLNPIIFQNGTGLVIFGNKTGQQNVQSALSSINVREVVIYIQDGIAAILKNYLFEFNTAQTRLEIKTLADNFMSTVQSENGVFDFRNIMDETNNTPDVIDQNIGILDTYIEPVRGMEILVHRTTILRTGQIATGNFI
jgi:hypothetical protein